MEQVTSSSRKEARLREIIDDIIGDGKLFVVDVEVHSQNGRHALNVYLESDEGITIDECARVHRELSAVLMEELVFTEPVRINVSSPGVKRPLTVPRQFKRHVGRRLKVMLKQDDGETAVEGELVSVSNDDLTLDMDGRHVSYDFGNVKEATVKLPW